MAQRPLVLIPAVALAGLAALAAAAGTYRWVDKDGTVHYSDRPQPGAEKVQLPEAQTYEAPPAPMGAGRSAATGASKVAPSPGAAAAPTGPPCAILSPKPDETLLNVQSVTVGFRGPQQATATLLFDGAPQTDAGGRQSYTISPITRGEHTVQVVFTAGGREACRTAAVRFFVRQPSVLAPSNPNRPRPRS
ncbi:MAG: DUF4124 domain-containing protein [Steroidobacteraceae bacterium]